MEKIKLKTKKRFVYTRNPFDERSIEYIDNNTFLFEKGKIYGIVCEHGGGGEAISSFMSNQVSWKDEKIYFDDMEVKGADVQQLGWYMGKPIYSKGLIKREVSVRKALNYAIKKYHRYENIEDIIEEFHLTPGRLDYGISKYSGEKWRVSLAIGYASNRIIYCFPWMNTLELYDSLLNSAVYCFFRKIKSEGAIIILPTSRKENVADFVDEVIEINNPRFENVISEDPCFKEYF